MTHSRLLRASLFAPVLLALTLPSDDVSFRPTAGSELKKELKIEVALQPANLQFTMNGESMPADSIAGLDESATVKLVASVTEKYVEAAKGRPIDLLRTFDDLSLAFESGSEKEEAPDFDRLEGKTIRFQWKEDGETYERSFHESEGDEVLLTNLSDDMDLRVLLPAKAVADGESWEVPGARLLPLFLPGGLPGEVVAEDDADSARAAWDEVQGQLGQLLEHLKLTCKYQGARDEAGVRVGVIHFTFTGKSPLDLSKAFESLAEDDEVKPTIDASASVDLDGEGDLLWDLSAGRVHALDMTLESKIGLSVKAEADVEGETFQFEIEGRIDGKGTCSLTTSSP